MPALDFMQRFTVHLLLVCLLGGFARASEVRLGNLQQVADQIWCGATPGTSEDFAAIAKLGVRIIVSVDGEKPAVENAQKHNLRYVHIPIGYDGVPRGAQLMLVRLIRDAQGPYYFHCHHGKHRGPTMAALAGVASESLTEHQALSILRKAGTSTDYTGLWQSVQNWKPATSNELLPELVEFAETSSLVGHMVVANRSYLGLKAIYADRANQSKITKQREMAALLYESLYESARLPTVRDNQALSKQFGEAIAVAEMLRAELKRERSSTATIFGRLSKSCTACHAAFR